jgi:hypothetical protein
MARYADSQTTGRTVLLLVGASAVGIAAVFGYTLGLVAPGALPPVRLAGVTLFEPTPGGIALYGAIATATGLLALFGLVQVASRFDSASRQG